MPKRTKIPGTENLFHIEGSDKIYLIDSFPGLGEVVRSTRQTKLSDAKRVAKDLIREILKLDPNYKPKTIEEVAREYLEVLESENRESTMVRARIHINNRIIAHLGHVRLDGKLRHEWAQFTKNFYAGKLDVTSEKTKNQIGGYRQPTTLFNTRKYWVSILAYARDEGYVTKPFGDRKSRGSKLAFPIDDPPPREGKFIPEAHYQRMLAACENQKFCDDLRLKPIKRFVKIGYKMGMREDEILGMDAERINLPRRSFTLRDEDVKAGAREIRIAPEVYDDVLDAMKNGERFLFPSKRSKTGRIHTILPQWRRLMRRAGLTAFHYNPNDLRHTFSTRKRLIEKRDPQAVAIYMGNSVLVNEKRYTHNKFKNTATIVDAEVSEEWSEDELTSESGGKSGHSGEALH